MLNWQTKVNEADKKNVQSLFEVFDKFISQNHKTQFSYDEKARREWQTFKKIIEADPANVEAQNQYVNIMKNNASQKQNELFKIMDRNMNRFENIAPILMQINRNKLEQAARKASRLITKNNKNLIY